MSEPIIQKDELDPPDTDFYGLGCTFYESIYVGFVSVHQTAIDDFKTWLAFSRDSFNWHRLRSRPFLPLGEEGDFNGGTVATYAMPVFLENETRFYYNGHPGWEVDEQGTGVGFAVMRRDRFAGVRPIARVGQITLRAMDLGRWDAMSLNADAIKGRIRCEVLNENGYRLRGFTREDAVPVEGDSLQHPVRWRENNLSDLPAEPLHLRLHLENAEVFAFTLAKEKS